MDNDEILTASEVAEWLRTPPKTLAQWRYLRKGPKSFRAGKRVLYRRSDVTRWVDAQIGSGGEAA